jgi:hypothetical protein
MIRSLQALEALKAVASARPVDAQDRNIIVVTESSFVQGLANQARATPHAQAKYSPI